MHWFASDEHYNHTNCLTKFIFRPFANTEQMNGMLIRRHNERVKPGHTVFHLGDFRVTNDGPNKHEILQQLNGNHVFLLGNHDRQNGCNTPLRYAVIETYGKQVLLCHRPEDAEIIAAKLAVNLCFVGHVHEKWKFRRYGVCDMINVGVDQWDYYPVDAKQILKAYHKWRINGILPENG